MYCIRTRNAIRTSKWLGCKTAIAIQATLWLIKIISNTVISASQLILNRIISATQHKRSWIAKQLKSLAEFSSRQLRSVNFLRSLINEIVIVY
ncbi:hypothetical protein LC613_04670 [Nostoc sphaeroides CHAB 2801]|uniref:hypothetical protein n=1 Tax=Nostoc sphaeroides TaxID=446679 RepID=UPI0015F2F4AD|nr:hypothetical protein [Nostoc sphaeroides]MCC5627486.1 hypothetical protein [Nostoc sphaeroides CHAB 2801]